MTGQGHSRVSFGNSEITAEVKSVNNRHLKIHSRVADAFSRFEPRIEALVKSKVRRGTVQLSVQFSSANATHVVCIEESVIGRYVTELRGLAEKHELSKELAISDLLALPGVIQEPRELPSDADSNGEFEESVARAVEACLDSLNAMREAEGKSMQLELQRQLGELCELATQIDRRAPQVVEGFRQRLQQRLNAAISDQGMELPESDLIREIAIVADKVDIREEIVRLRSHFEQFAGLLDASASQGRKLDFLIQEMFREANTIGAKANDAELAHKVVDLKTTLEQMRELVQNVE